MGTSGSHWGGALTLRVQGSGIRQASPQAQPSSVHTGPFSSLSRRPVNSSGPHGGAGLSTCTSSALTSGPSRPHTPGPPVEVLSEVAGVRDVQAFGDRAHVRMDDVPTDRAIEALRAALLQAGLRVVSARRISPSLEDVFIDLITGTTAGRES